MTKTSYHRPATWRKMAVRYMDYAARYYAAAREWMDIARDSVRVDDRDHALFMASTWQKSAYSNYQQAQRALAAAGL